MAATDMEENDPTTLEAIHTNHVAFLWRYALDEARVRLEMGVKNIRDLDRNYFQSEISLCLSERWSRCSELTKE